MKIGYVRVSAKDQKLDVQIGALKEAGCEKIYKEKITGSKRDRPQLVKMLEHIRAGDVVIITKYDRLSCSLRDLIDIVGQINEKDAGFKRLAKISTQPRRAVVLFFMCSVRLQNLNVNELWNEQKRD